MATLWTLPVSVWLKSMTIGRQAGACSSATLNSNSWAVKSSLVGSSDDDSAGQPSSAPATVDALGKAVAVAAASVGRVGADGVEVGADAVHPATTSAVISKAVRRASPMRGPATMRP